MMIGDSIQNKTTKINQRISISKNKQNQKITKLLHTIKKLLKIQRKKKKKN